jgi:hypothetical protein
MNEPNVTEKSQDVAAGCAPATGSARTVAWLLVRYFAYPICGVLAATSHTGGVIACSLLWALWSANILHEREAPNKV